MKSIKNHAGLILKTLLYQIVMSLFGMMMYGATSRIRVLSVIGLLAVVLFYFYILISQMYQNGFKTYEKDHSHGEKSSATAGFLFAFIAFLPTILLSLWSTMIPPFLSDGTPVSYSYIPFLINKSFLQGMYILLVQMFFPTGADTAGAVNAIMLNSQSIMYLILAVPGILLCGLGYLLGYRQFGFSFPSKKHKKQ